MPIIFEHCSIPRTLDCLNLRSLTDDATLPAEPSSRIVFIGWSSREDLLLRPEYAWLHLDCVTCMQLPLSLEGLRAGLHQSTLIAKSDANYENLRTELGQWQWALNQLRQPITNGDEKNPIVRVRHLQQFALRFWPGLYDQTLNALAESLHDKARALSLLDQIISTFNLGAAVVACHPVLKWAEQATIQTKVMTLGDALYYLIQGDLNDVEPAREAARSLDLAAMERDVMSVNEGLELITRLGCQKDYGINEQLAGMSNSLIDIKEVRNFSSSTPMSEINSTYESTENLIKALEHIRKVKQKATAILREIV